MNKCWARLISALLIVALMLGVGQAALAEGNLMTTLPVAWQWFGKGTDSRATLTGIRMTRSSATVGLASTRDAQVDLSKYIRPVPSKAVLPVLSWTTTDPQIAPIDAETGVVTFANEGKVRLTATTPDGKKASMVITIKAVRVSKIKSSGTVTLSIGETGQIQTAISPSNATYPWVQYASDNESVASVDASGAVTALSDGTARVTVTVDGKSAVSTVQVRPREGGVTIKISAVGDITLGGDTTRGTFDDFKKYVTKYEKEMGNRYTGMFINAAKYFSQDDLTIGNLEGALTTSNAREKGTYHFKGDPSYANMLSQSSIEFVNLANNHTRGYGSGGYENTKSALNKAGVKWNGFGKNEYRILDVNGLKVGLIGYQTGSYGPSAATIGKNVKSLKAKCDVVIVSMHFCDTPEYTNSVTGMMKTYARTAVKNGADLVLGHHPHVLSGMESYLGRNIVYGLGTFLASGPNPIRPRRTMIYQQSFVVYPDFVEVKDTKVIPFWVTSSKKVNDKRPTPAPGGEVEAIIKTIEKYSVGQKVDYEIVR